MRRLHSARPRKGFALVTALWLLAAVAIVTAAVRLAATDAIATSRNRILGIRGRWAADGCLAGALEQVDGVLATARNETERQRAWATIDARLASSDGACTIDVQPRGARRDVTLMGDSALAAVLASIGGTDADAAALLDWQDADDAERVGGAERARYVAEGAIPPRNAPMRAPAELRLVRGIAALGGWEEVLGVGEGKPCLNVATEATLRTLPGFTPLAAERVVARRANGEVITDLEAFARELPPGARDTLMGKLPELLAMAVLLPESWEVRVRVTVAGMRTIEVVGVLARAGDRGQFVQRRGE